MKKKKKKNKLHARVKRVFAVMAGIVVVMFAADNIRRDLFKRSTNESVLVDGSFISKINPSVPPSTTPLNGVQKPDNVISNTKNVSFESVEISADKLTEGLLVRDDDTHSVQAADTKKMVDLAEYKNEYYTVMGANVMLNSEAAEAFNLLMTDYFEETGLKDFVVYGTTDTYVGSDSYCPRYFPERASGNTIDLALIAYGSFLAYDGLDTESWVNENCTKYGFIVRYPEEKSDMTGKVYCPWHLRYVGKLNAAVMKSKNMCLEEYIEFLKDYDVDSPYTYKMNNNTYVIYTAESEGKATSIKVPSNNDYELSGDNIDTFIVSYER